MSPKPDIPWRKRWPGQWCCKATIKTADGSFLDFETTTNSVDTETLLSRILLIMVCGKKETKTFKRLVKELSEECKAMLEEKDARTG